MTQQAPSRGWLGRWRRRGRQAVRPLARVLGPSRGEAPIGADLDTGSKHRSEPVPEVTGLLVPRSWVTVTGEVSSVIYRPKASTQAFVVDLRTSREQIALVFLGRRSVPGIQPGIRLRATGRVSTHKGAKIIYNPAYDVISGSEHAGG